jgi:DNA polymerase alpha subunit B
LSVHTVILSDRSAYQAPLLRLDGLTPNAHGRTPNGANSSTKRRSDFGSPSLLKVVKTDTNQSPNSKTAAVAVNGGGAVDGLQYESVCEV